MLLGGDELGNSQQGNNNAYCQDNVISWVDWSNVDTELLDFTKNLVKFRQSHPVFRRRKFLTGSEADELGWFTPAGTPMTQDNWADSSALALTIYLDGADDPDPAPDGTPLLDDDFLVLVNAWWEPMEFVIPETLSRQLWLAEIDSYDPAAPAAAAQRHPGDRVTLGPRSMSVLRASRPVAPAQRRRPLWR
jgi:glycogen operon protein